MQRFAYRLAPLLLLLLLPLSGCLAARSGSSTAPLSQGFSEGSAGGQSAASGGAKVLEARPGVVAIYAGRADQLKAGMNVPLSAILRSDASGKARLSLPDGSTVKVAPNTEIALADFADVPVQESAGTGFGKGLARLLSGGSSGGGTAAAGTSPQATIGIRGLQAR